MRKAMLVLAVFGLVSLASAADPFVGTWKMNPAKSKFSYPAPKSFTVTFTAQDNGVKVVQDMIEADGKTIHRSFALKYDGKEYPVTAPDQDAISVKKSDPNTVEYVAKKKGKRVWSGRAVVAKDGKFITDIGSGNDEKGQTFTYSFLLEKQ